MTVKSAMLSFLVYACSSPGALAQEIVCSPNLIDENVCELAQKIGSATLTQLPLTTNDGTQIVDVVVEKSTVNVSAVWAWSSEELLTLLRQTLVPLSQFKADAVISTQRMACGAEVLASFIRLGGEVRYTYRTSDNVRVFETIVVHCNSDGDSK